MTHSHVRITTALFIFANFKFGDVTPEMIVQSNGNFTLQPNVQGTLEEILWKRNNHKVVEFDQKEVVAYRQFKGRTTLDLTTGALTLTHLTEADSGEYVGELQIKGELVYHRQTVKVFDAVGKPAVTCQVNGPSVTLLCSGGDRPSTQYRWEGPAIEPQPGSQLKIEAAESSDAIYTCVLHNPVGESRTDFPVKSCFPAPGSASVVISVVIVLLLLFIIVGLLLFYYKKCYKKRQNEEVMEAQSVERQNEMDTGVQSEVKVQDRVKLIESGWTPVKTHDERQKTALTEQHKGTDRSAGISQEESQTVQDRVKLIERGWGPGKTHDEHQKTALTEQHKGTDGSAGISQEERQTESLNQGEDSEEKGVETEGGNSKHPSSGTVPSSAPESPPAAPSKTGNEEETFHIPPSSPSLPHPLKSPPAPAPAPVQSQDQGEKTEGVAAAAESTDETGANQRAGAQRQREKGEGQDGGSDGGGAQPSGAGGGGAENPTADPTQELPNSPEEEEDRQGPDTNGRAAQCSEAGGGGDESVPKPDSDQDIDPTSAEENLSAPPTEPLSTADSAQGLLDTTARSPPHTGASEESCCAEESPTSGPNLEPNSTSEAEEEKRGRQERKDSQDRGVKSPPVKPPKPPAPPTVSKKPLNP